MLGSIQKRRGRLPTHRRNSTACIVTAAATRSASWPCATRDVVDREATGDRFDHVRVDAGRLYVAYDDPDSLGRDPETEGRVYAVPDYQTALVESPVSHVSARGAADGEYRVFEYDPDGPNVEAHRM